MPKIIFRAEIFKEGNLYVSICPELNVSSFGETIEEAKSSLREAVEAFTEECEAMGTLEEVMSETGFIKELDTWVHRKPLVEELLSVGR
ncbi:type II toxin-antitoxin system HicB family antitoxin [Dehalococcoidia bacterium]|nr:type II toxin-antitoxin system HicB family antitoxin [Dehalococcoidia bacterium]